LVFDRVPCSKPSLQIQERFILLKIPVNWCQFKKKINRPESWTHREHERLRHIHKNFTILDLWHEKGLSLPCLCKAEDKSVTGLVASQRMGHCSIYRTASFTQIGKLAMMPALSLVQV
jgi:hypothetical protein